MSLVIQNVRLLCPYQEIDSIGAVRLEEGRITHCWHAVPLPAVEATSVINGTGLCLTPALIDLRYNEAAQATDTLAHGLTLAPCGHLSEGMAGERPASYGLYREQGITLCSDGLRPLPSLSLLFQAMRYSAIHGVRLHVLPFEKTFALTGAMAAGELATRQGLTGVLEVAETLAVTSALHLVEASGCPLHLGPLTTAAGVALVRAAKANGLPVSADTSLAYLTFNELAASAFDTRAGLFPPLRREEDRLALLAGLQDGTLDAVTSDHQPVTTQSKNLPYASAAVGMAVWPYFLPLLLRLYHQGTLPLLATLRLATARPAALAGLSMAGLTVGAQTPLVLFDLTRSWRTQDRSSPLYGMPLEGKVVPNALLIS
jgi:dihydroorotase